MMRGVKVNGESVNEIVKASSQEANGERNGEKKVKLEPTVMEMDDIKTANNLQQ